MRTLIFLFIGLLMLTAMLGAKWLDARRASKDVGVAKSENPTLSARLKQSATLYRKAAQALPEESDHLRAAIFELADQCSALASRDGFSRSARSTIIRLLLSLNDVVDRVSKTADGPLTDRASDLITEATKTLSVIADRADDTVLRRLEADLDVLKDRLDALRE